MKSTHVNIYRVNYNYSLMENSVPKNYVLYADIMFLLPRYALRVTINKISVTDVPAAAVRSNKNRNLLKL